MFVTFQFSVSLLICVWPQRASLGLLWVVLNWMKTPTNEQTIACVTHMIIHRTHTNTHRLTRLFTWSTCPPLVVNKQTRRRINNQTSKHKGMATLQIYMYIYLCLQYTISRLFVESWVSYFALRFTLYTLYLFQPLRLCFNVIHWDWEVKWELKWKWKWKWIANTKYDILAYVYTYVSMCVGLFVKMNWNDALSHANKSMYEYILFYVCSFVCISALVC